MQPQTSPQSQSTPTSVTRQVASSLAIAEAPFDREVYFKEQKEKVDKLIDGHLQQLAADLDAGRSDTLKAYLKTMSKFHHYSFGNQILIAIQNPEATHVAGFHAWKQFNRFVKKGEKGILILAPITKVIGTAREQQKDGTSKEVPVRKIVNSKAVYVFDVTQTQGEPLPEFAKIRGNPADQLTRLERFYAEQGVELKYVKSIAGGALGVSQGKKVKVLASLDEAGKFRVAAHEMAHEMLHQDEERRKETTKKIRETEAEAVAFVVCSAAGLDCSTASSDYLHLYGGNRATLEGSLQAIRRASKTILEAVLPKRQQGTAEPKD